MGNCIYLSSMRKVIIPNKAFCFFKYLELRRCFLWCFLSEARFALLPSLLEVLLSLRAGFLVLPCPPVRRPHLLPSLIHFPGFLTLLFGSLFQNLLDFHFLSVPILGPDVHICLYKFIINFKIYYRFNWYRECAAYKLQIKIYNIFIINFK